MKQPKDRVIFAIDVDEKEKYMSYNRLYKFEKRGMHIQLFKEIFSKFNVSEHLLIYIVFFMDGGIYSGE